MINIYFNIQFKEPIKPMWEDEGNKSGGKFSLKVKKDFTTIIWEELVKYNLNYYLFMKIL